MNRNRWLFIIIILLFSVIPLYILRDTDHSEAQSSNQAFQLRNPDKVMEDTLLNPFQTKTKIKILGDSITAGAGATGYGLTNQMIGKTGYYIPKQNSMSWANQVKKHVEEKYNEKVFINPLDPRISYKYQGTATKNDAYKLKMAAYTKGKGARVSFDFMGTAASLYFTKQNGSAIVDIYVDGKKVTRQDLYSGSNQYGHVVKLNQLTYGKHTVEIQSAGKNPKSISDRIFFEGIELQKNAVVENWGVSGQDSEWLFNNKDTLIEKDDDVVMIQIGTNDRIDSYSAEAIKAHLIPILEKCKAERKHVILLSANPTSIEDDTLKGTRKFTMYEVDEAIKGLAADYGITYISNYQAFFNYTDTTGNSIDSLLKDGLHPNDKGYEIMYKNVIHELGLSRTRSL
ncbi:GDSL-type esterase/lipase family protein [Cytobacillus spongiae]|uniref:GDSL-type esterase/lipase family protein n=1 Tax=Cytobacillus spongiae TaxID=2901381 RepID=UPI001F437A11|nr:GDSL-type esterase/lipase family protein [Cytobacillus spongiae]UII55647.1 GDSL-type esterase/lipase family protein [Cytobacillus spongiae]